MHRVVLKISAEIVLIASGCVGMLAIFSANARRHSNYFSSDIVFELFRQFWQGN